MMFSNSGGSKIFAYLLALFLTANILYGCSGCSKSGMSGSRNTNNIKNNTNPKSYPSKQGKTSVKMIKSNGTYQIPVEINGVTMSFTFDTGAGLISISATEAVYLYKQGKLKDEDFIGTANFQDANGNITEGTIILLQTVKIGDRTINNIKASVVHNMVAPLLFGQTALEKFGKISIDYKRDEITFE
jgi:aspartyl protease family protein